MALSSWKLLKRRVVVSHKPTAVTISFARQELVTYDLEGRLFGMYQDGTNLRRGLDNSFQKLWRAETHLGVDLRQQFLTPEQSQELVEKYRSQVALLLEDQAGLERDPDTAAVFRRIVGYTYERLQASASEFHHIYGHVPILPPDQYRALVLQATDGCTYNRCTFCTLYRDKSFTVRAPNEFRRHIDRVVSFMGAGISYRNSVFLGDANALAISQERLIELLEIVRTTADVKPLLDAGGLHAFLDIYTGARKNAAQYRALKELGLRRVSLGVESGCEALLEFVRKPGSREDIRQVVSTLKEAQLAVVVILMVGLGGQRFSQEHLTDTVSLVRSLPLTKGDIIYLSRFDPTPRAPYLPIAAAERIRPLSPPAMHDEIRRWKTLLDREVGRQGIKISPYSFQRFLY